MRYFCFWRYSSKLTADSANRIFPLPRYWLLFSSLAVIFDCTLPQSLCSCLDRLFLRCLCSPFCPGYLRSLTSSWDSCGISFILLGAESSLSESFSSSLFPARSFPPSPLVMGWSEGGRCSSASQTQWCWWRGESRKEGLEILLDLWWGSDTGLEFHSGSCADTMISFGQLNHVNNVLSSKAQPRGGGIRDAGSGVHSRALGSDIPVVHINSLLLTPYFLMSLGQKETNLLGNLKWNRTFRLEADYSIILPCFFIFMFICSLYFYSLKPLNPLHFFRGGNEGLEREGWEVEYFYLLRECEQILSWSKFHWSKRLAAPWVVVWKHSLCLLLCLWQITWQKMRRCLRMKSVSFSAQLTQSGLSFQKTDGLSLALSFFAAQYSPLWVSTEVKWHPSELIPIAAFSNAFLPGN